MPVKVALKQIAVFNRLFTKAGKIRAAFGDPLFCIQLFPLLISSATHLFGANS